MAKTSKRVKNQQKKALVDKFASKRRELKNVIRSANDLDEVMDAQLKLSKLPLNSNPVRYATRCMQCSRPHAVYRKFGLCRICLRKELMNGNIPGGRKSSW